MRSEFLIFLICGFVGINAQNFFQPKPCSKRDPNINECLKNLLNTLYPLDPSTALLRIQKIVIDNPNGPVSLQGSFNDVIFKGVENLHIVDVRSNLEKLRIDLKIQIPKLEMYSVHLLQGRLLFFPLASKGENFTIVDGISMILKFQFSRVDKNGQSYLKITEAFADFTFKKVKFKLTDVNSEALGQIMTQLFNDNPEVIADELRAPLSKAYASALSQVFQNILSEPETNYLID